MKYFGKNKALAEEMAVGGAPDHTSDAEMFNVEKDDAITTGPHKKNVPDDSNSLEKVPSADAQAGVRKVEAVTLTWTKQELILAYAWSVYHSSNQRG